MARMVVIYNKPVDIEAFERHYYGIHIPLAKALPGIIKYEVSQGPIVSLAALSDVWLIGTLHFESLAAIKIAFASEAGRACAVDREKYAPDPSTFQMYLFDDKEV